MPRVIDYDDHSHAAGPGIQQMTNPYDPPRVESTHSWDEQSLLTLKPLQQAILTLRIIVLALASGVIMFAAITLFLRRQDQPWGIGQNLDALNIVMLAMGAMCLAMGILLPAVMFRAIPAPPQVGQQFASQGPEVLRVMQVQARIQVTTIIGAALFEGGAFANLVAFMTTGELLNLLAAGLLLVAIAALFPWPGRCEQRIAGVFRREAEEQSFRRDP
jgi:hypothetical protein